jgi:polysaccharide export outer membrane protein
MRIPVVSAIFGALAVAAICGAQNGTSSDMHYHVGPGDVIRVDAFQNKEISGEFSVEPSGKITFPLLGVVEVGGRTTSEISRHLESLLERDFYVDVQLQVDVTDYKSMPVTLLGEVQRPGTFYLKGRTTLTQLIAEAGGLTSNSGEELELRRVEVIDGQSVNRVFTFPTAKLRTGEQGTDVEIRTGDVLSVSAKALYFITGEVARPGQYEISRGMTVMQALSQAGGQSKFASQTVELHRDTGGQKQILSVDLSQIRKGKQVDPQIQRGDVLIVRRRFF